MGMQVALTLFDNKSTCLELCRSEFHTEPAEFVMNEMYKGKYIHIQVIVDINS